MADVVRCERGHFYDRSVFVKCPHCEKEETRDTKNTGYRGEVAKFAMEYMRSQQGQQDARPPVRTVDPATEAERAGRFEPEAMYGGRNAGAGPEAAGAGRPAPVNPPRSPQEDVTIGKTSPRRAPDKDGKTIGFSANSQKNIYVTGWLVCVDGPNKGCSFNLYYGYNTIGYSRSNRICLLEDTSVARKVHCSVIYEDRKNKFYLVPEENQETRLNGTPVEGMGELQTGDLINLGKTTLEFIAFCRGERKWDRKEMQKAASQG